MASRTIAPMGFLVQIDPFAFADRRRFFIAELDGSAGKSAGKSVGRSAGRKIVGFLGVIPIYARDGWFFEDFLRDPDAPNGSVELLVDGVPGTSSKVTTFASCIYVRGDAQPDHSIQALGVVRGCQRRIEGAPLRRR
jgi:hypothetical protein